MPTASTRADPTVGIPVNEFYQRLAALSPAKRELFAMLDPGRATPPAPDPDVAATAALGDSLGGGRGHGHREGAASNPPVEERLIQIFAEVLDLPAEHQELAAGARIADLGGGEAETSRVLQLVSERLGVTLDGRDLYRVDVLGAAVRRAARARQVPQAPAAPVRRSSLVPIRTGGGRPPLFCVHAASGSAYPYAPLGRLLPEDQPVYAFEAPGLEDGRMPAESIEELAAEYVRLVRAVADKAPCLLLGWSLGGLVAFEMARQLTSGGGLVRRLVVVDAPPPIGSEPPTESEIRQRFLEDLTGSPGQPGVRLATGGGRGGRDEDWPELVRRLRADGLLSADVDGDLLRRRYAVFRANARAAVRYRPQWRLPGRLAVIRAAESVLLRSTWTSYADSIDEYEVSGAHYSMWEADRLPAICRIIVDSGEEATTSVVPLPVSAGTAPTS